MNKLLALLATAALFAAAPVAVAAETNSQQDKMKTCNTQAGDKKGDERKAFMKTCLSATPAPPPKAESKMAMCNKKTAGLNEGGTREGAKRVHEGASLIAERLQNTAG